VVTFQQESLYEIIDEVDELLQLHYLELTLNRDKIKLEPMWERYSALEFAGAFVVYTARSNGRLIGYSAFFLNNHLHYADLKTAINDVLYIHPDFRVGRTGIGMIRFSERSLVKQLGSFKLVWHAKLSNELSSILERMGYSVEEVMLAKHF